ncbi:hypothetical protein GOODEAATRI_016949 [Goodea atripinnis]|uniref:Uncharacterized protein n=1 Tax=Goodea atripinnis TaxID=208336 RepID=A0ABV0MSV8_9TELE
MGCCHWQPIDDWHNVGPAGDHTFAICWPPLFTIHAEVRCIDFIEQNLQMQQLVACSYFWNSSSGGRMCSQEKANQPRGSTRCVEAGHARRKTNRRRKAGCCYYHESRGLPPCEQLQSGQLEAEPEAYLSVLRVERFSRDQKTQGIACQCDIHMKGRFPNGS